MSPNDAVPLYLTILMAILCFVALYGGHMADKKRAGRGEKDE